MARSPYSDPDPEPDSPDEPKTHRRRRSTVWKRTPAQSKLIVGACLVLVGLSIFALQRRWFKPRPNEPIYNVVDRLLAKLPTADLVLSKSSLNLQTRCIEGVVTNNSAKAYSNVQVTFFILSGDVTSSSEMDINIASLAPHASVPFVTGPLDPGVTWSVQEIKAAPVGAAAARKTSSPPAAR